MLVNLKLLEKHARSSSFAINQNETKHIALFSVSEKIYRHTPGLGKYVFQFLFSAKQLKVSHI